MDVNESRYSCPVCIGRPRVLVALKHPTMRRFTLELLARDHACWKPLALGHQGLVDAIQSQDPDLVVLDASTFNACQGAADRRFPCCRMVVVGPEPDLAYMSAVLGRGAGGWVARDDIAERLSTTMRGALGCSHVVCPPALTQQQSVAARNAVP